MHCCLAHRPADIVRVDSEAHGVSRGSTSLHPFLTTLAQNSEKDSERRTGERQLWPKGVSGKTGRRPEAKPITDELERLLFRKSPNHKGNR